MEASSLSKGRVSRNGPPQHTQLTLPTQSSWVRWPQGEKRGSFLFFYRLGWVPLWCQDLCWVHWRNQSRSGTDLDFQVCAPMEEASSESHNLGSEQTLLTCAVEVPVQYSGGLEAGGGAERGAEPITTRFWTALRSLDFIPGMKKSFFFPLWIHLFKDRTQPFKIVEHNINTV